MNNNDRESFASFAGEASAKRAEDVAQAVSAARLVHDYIRELRSDLQDVASHLREHVPTNTPLVTRQVSAWLDHKGLLGGDRRVRLDVAEETHGDGWEFGPLSERRRQLVLDRNAELWLPYEVTFGLYDPQSSNGITGLDRVVRGHARLDLSQLEENLASVMQQKGRGFWEATAYLQDMGVRSEATRPLVAHDHSLAPSITLRCLRAEVAATYSRKRVEANMDFSTGYAEIAGNARDMIFRYVAERYSA